MNDAPSRRDIVNCYRLALGRDPESEAVVEEKLRQPKSGLLPDFFSSSEFDEGVRKDVIQGSLLQPGFRERPTAEIKAWIAGFAPISPEGAQAVKSAENWPGVYRALFSDDVFAAQILNGAARDINSTFISALSAREQVESISPIEGRIELITPHEIRGWALDAGDPDRRLGLELWIDGRFRGAVVADLYRRELQERFGGSGVFGFVTRRPSEPKGSGPVRAELREIRSGAVVEVFQLPSVQPPPHDASIALRRELAEIRALLTRIEARLPDVNEAYSFGLDLYADYFDSYYAPVEAAVRRGEPMAGLVALVDATSATPAELTNVLTDLADQAQPPYSVVVMQPGGDLKPDFDYALSPWRGRFQDLEAPYGMVADEGWAAMIQAAVERMDAPHFLLIQAGARLTPDASQRVGAALKAGASLVYADSDTVEVSPDGVVERRFAPAFRTSFDAELFLQQGDLGPLVGLSRRLIEAAGLRSPKRPAGLYDCVLRVLPLTEVGDFVHISRVLSHTCSPHLDKVAARLDLLRAYLDANHIEAEASRHADILGATLPSALRVRHALPAGATAAVIVPTRDRLDLLEPCLEKIVALSEHNRTRLELIVVDNQSQEAETFTFLDRFSRAHPLIVLKHAGVFNWALMNNLAAAQTKADVLIFLNNDTVALNPDWCDELCSQALRPDVGGVGARLLYGDGTIQHAGVVTGGRHAFTAHEGVGAQGNDPGYLGRHALLREVSAVTGACLATRRCVFESVGGFDAVNLPVESNDVDYCFRVRASGLKVLYDPYCTLYHYESKSRGYNVDPQRLKQADAAGLLMRGRWEKIYRDDPFYNPHFDRLSAPLTRLGPPPA